MAKVDVPQKRKGSSERGRTRSRSPRSASTAVSSGQGNADAPARGRSTSEASSSPARGPAPLSEPLPEPKYQHRRTAGEVRRCKKGKRTDIKPGDWAKFGYVRRDEVLRRPIVYDSQTVPIPRVKRSEITPQFFYENFACKHQPVIIEGVADDWPAMQRWSLEAMEERFRHVDFKVAKDDKGKKLRMKFKYYADYLRHQQDDSPLYLFETSVDENALIRQLNDDYEVPDIFPHDWLGLVNQDSRPPYRWFCIGPKRSGTTVHTDPLGTAAWNVVTHGCKHWVLMKPGEARRAVKGKDVIQKGEDDEAIMYYDFVLPRIKKKYPDLQIFEALQHPGEAIFVPGDWWHGVLNREDTVAVTQNYVGPDNFDLVWKRARKEREKVAYLWLRNMHKFAPSLSKRALALNRRDHFRMRHERGPDEKLSSGSSSSSESSSDSSSDEAEDLDPVGLEAVLPPEVKLGAGAYKLQGDKLPSTAVEPRRSGAAAGSYIAAMQEDVPRKLREKDGARKSRFSE
mmetsp:Transcript_11240/g.25614  ORF Transcript_11240/g.25614 Transcript_11240/m.25614 type:complete len:512 (-) Transcript_11240:85-1620(-)